MFFALKYPKKYTYVYKYEHAVIIKTNNPSLIFIMPPLFNKQAHSKCAHFKNFSQL